LFFLSSRDYYAARGIPFDEGEGYVARAAFEANPEWAWRFDVRRYHFEPLGAHGLDRAHPTRVDEW